MEGLDGHDQCRPGFMARLFDRVQREDSALLSSAANAEILNRSDRLSASERGHKKGHTYSHCSVHNASDFALRYSHCADCVVALP
jgi:hypothetical protein